MKKVFIFIMLISILGRVCAQSLTIVNSTGCTYQITMFASNTTMNGYTSCPSGCDEIMSNTFNIPGSTTYSWCNPLDFQNGTGCGGGPSVAFSSIECGTYTIIEGWACSSSNPWATCIPSGWVWTYANIDLGCLDANSLPCLAGHLGGVCWSSPLSSTGAPGCSGAVSTATWSSSGGNITITIN